MELGCWTVIAVGLSVGYSVGCFSPLQNIFPNGVFSAEGVFPTTMLLSMCMCGICVVVAVVVCTIDDNLCWVRVRVRVRVLLGTGGN